MGVVCHHGNIHPHTLSQFVISASVLVLVYQFRGFSEFCDSITKVGWIAMGNVRYTQYYY